MSPRPEALFLHDGVGRPPPRGGGRPPGGGGGGGGGRPLGPGHPVVLTTPWCLFPSTRGGPPPRIGAAPDAVLRLRAGECQSPGPAWGQHEPSTGASAHGPRGAALATVKALVAHRMGAGSGKAGRPRPCLSLSQGRGRPLRLEGGPDGPHYRNRLPRGIRGTVELD